MSENAEKKLTFMTLGILAAFALVLLFSGCAYEPHPATVRKDLTVATSLNRFVRYDDGINRQWSTNCEPVISTNCQGFQSAK